MTRYCWEGGCRFVRMHKHGRVQGDGRQRYRCPQCHRTQSYSHVDDRWLDYPFKGGHYDPAQHAWVLALAAQGLSLAEIQILTGIGRQWAGKIIQAGRKNPDGLEQTMQSVAANGLISAARAYQTYQRFLQHDPVLDEARHLPPPPKGWLVRVRRNSD